jgi:hypothetical protein
VFAELEKQKKQFWINVSLSKIKVGTKVKPLVV